MHNQVLSFRFRVLPSRLLFLFLIAICFFLAKPKISFADKDYHFERIKIDVTVNQDKSFDFVEERTFDFSGDFSWATYTLPIKGTSEIVDFSVSENGEGYQEDPSGSEGTFTVQRDPTKLFAKWYYSASDEKRTFTFRFHAVDGVKLYNDTAELYWKFIGEDSDKGTDFSEVTVNLPQGAEKNEIKAWLHAPLQGLVKIVDGQTVRFTVPNLPPNTFVEGRILFPPRLLEGALVDEPVDKKPEILEEEKRWAEEANRRRQIARTKRRLGLYLGIFIPLIFLGIYLLLYFKFGKEHKPQFEGEYYRELPGKYGPAILGYLWQMGKVDLKDMTATIMDLARRGFLKITEKKEVKKGLLGTKEDFKYLLEETKPPKGAKFEGYEEYLLGFIFKTVGAGSGKVYIDEIEDYAKKHTSTFQEVLTSWKNLVKEESKQYGFLEKEGNAVFFVNIFLGILQIGAGVLILVLTQSFFAMIPMIFGGVQVFLSFFLKRRSRQAVEQFQKWKAFKKYLTDFSNLKEQLPSAMIIWEHYLVYAVTLGVAKEVIEQLKVIVPQTEAYSGYAGPAWFAASGGLGRMSSLDSLSSGFSSFETAATSAMASAAGTGGGASMGGGGGGGGGGVSAG